METKDMIELLNERGHYAREVGCEVLGVPDIVACVSGCANLSTGADWRSKNGY